MCCPQNFSKIPPLGGIVNIEGLVNIEKAAIIYLFNAIAYLALTASLTNTYNVELFFRNPHCKSSNIRLSLIIRPINLHTQLVNAIVCSFTLPYDLIN